MGPKYKDNWNYSVFTELIRCRSLHE